jgi:hypothetical protein
MFYFDEINGKKVLKSTVLDGVNHFFTTRGYSIFDMELGELVHPTQTHTSIVDVAQIGKSDYPDTDGLIITNSEQTLYLNFADCTPLIFYDYENKIGAVSHAGWRGTAGMIGVKTAEKMVSEFNSKPKNIKCAIGPAIGFCCYNVGEDVYKQLMATVKLQDDLSEIRNDDIFVDLKAINKRQLEEFGLEEIDVCPYCTVCNNDLFYSYRKENGTKHRHHAVLKLN